MNISRFLYKQKDNKYATPFRRGFAAVIDVWITMFLRAVFAQIVAFLFMNQALYDFKNDFMAEFSTSIPKYIPQHLDFFFHHRFFYYLLVFYSSIILIGAIYHAYLNSSAWNGTVGKRLMKIIITTENELPITFNRALFHYFLSTLPFVFMFYLVAYQVKNNLTFYQAIIASDFNIIFGILFVFWVQIHLFTKRKTTAYDLIANTVVINGKTAAKWPWHK